MRTDRAGSIHGNIYGYFIVLSWVLIWVLLIQSVPGHARVLTSVSVAPQDPVISIGQTQQFTAAGTYDDMSTHVFGSSVLSIAPGTTHTCAVLSDGIVRCWGDDTQGQLGDGNSGTNVKSFIPVSAIGIDNAVSVASSHAQYHTCAILADSTVRCWGYGVYGQLGDGNHPTSSSTPVTVIVIDNIGNNTPLTGAVGIAAGNYHTCAVLSDGTVWCWGANGNGQVGQTIIQNNINNYYSAVKVPGISNAIGITAGNLHTCALLSNGDVMCWGNNGYGQLGYTTTSPNRSDVPLPVNGINPTNNPNDSIAKAVTAGDNHTCAKLSDKTIKCWGSNALGQLGNGLHGINLYSTNPVNVNWIGKTGTTNPGAEAITAGNAFTCALLSDSNIMCWGSNSLGQIGANAITAVWEPDPIKKVQDKNRVPITASAIAAGADHACAILLDGMMQCWGSNNNGQLGTVTGPFSPKLYSTNVIDIFPVYWTSSNPVVAGIDFRGLADGLTAGTTTITAAVYGITGTTILQVVGCVDNDFDGYGSPGSTLCPNGVSTDCDDNNAAIHPNANEICNGADDNCNGVPDEGFTGLGTVCSNGLFGVCYAEGSMVCTPDGLGTKCSAVAGQGTAEICNGMDDDCDGTVDNGVTNRYYWDGDVDGYGDASVATDACTQPPNYVSDNTDCNDSNALVNPGAVEIKDNKGIDDDCNTATLDVDKSLTTITVTPANPNIKTGQKQVFTATAAYSDGSSKVIGAAKSPVSAGYHHTCIILDNGTVQCWGDNFYGQIGDGTNKLSNVPVNVSGITNAVAIQNGSDFSCALLSDGTIKCWGLNLSGQLGIDPVGTSSSSLPIAISGISNAVELVTGGNHVCAILADSTVSCWGDNMVGQLGRGTTGRISIIPTGVSGITGADAITAGMSHTCVLLTNGTVMCWGANNLGQLGTGDSLPSSTPVSVAGLNNVVAINAGYDHTCALLADGTVKCWGINSNTPVDVGLTNVKSVSGGGAHTCAILSNGTAVCWGDNGAGQLGDGTQNPSNIPVAVSGITNAAAIDAGFAYTCAILADSTARCWGAGDNGQLGHGSNTGSLTPAIVRNINNAAIGVVWESSNPLTSTIHRDDGSAAGISTGTAAISASSAGISGSTTLTVDGVPPTGTIVINRNSVWSKNRGVILTLSCTDNVGGSGCVDMQITNDGVFDTEPWESFSTTKSWTLSVGNGKKAVYVHYRDLAGNISIRYSDIILLDTVKPALRGISDTPDPVRRSLGEVSTVNFTVSDNLLGTCAITLGIFNSNNIKVRAITKNNVTCSSIGTANSIVWNGKNNFGFIVSIGTYSYKLQAIDKAGNASALSTTYDGTITVQ